MKIIPLAIPGVLRIEERVFHDERGSFAETYRQSVFDAAVGRPVVFVQDNYSRSTRNVLRGLHYQVEQPQGKLLRVTEGSVFDVVVDLRRSSPTFGHWIAETLSADNHRQLWIPEGLAHGFLVLSEHASVAYKATAYYAPEHQRCLAWNDPTLSIEWHLDTDPILSVADRLGAELPNADCFP